MTEAPVRDTRRIVGWIAYYTDWSGMVFFSTEAAALRHAVRNSMQVFPIRNGDDLRAAAETAWRAESADG